MTNLAHNAVRAMGAHEWHGLFKERWVDVSEHYRHNAAAQAQRRGLSHCFEILRLQLPLKQNQADTAKGLSCKPPGIVKDA